MTAVLRATPFVRVTEADLDRMTGEASSTAIPVATVPGAS